jgi:hypothetical protein
VLADCDADTYRRYVRPVSHALPEDAPSEHAVVLLCHTVDAEGSSASRVYVLFNREDYDEPSVSRFLATAAGTRALDVARMYPRAGIGLKRDGTDMLGIGLRPTGRRRIDPACLMTPVMIPLVNAGVRIPELAERLHRVSWVTIPLDDDSLECPRVMREMNVYVTLDGERTGR